MGVKGIIFDFDGTLADTLPVAFYAFQRVFNEFDRRQLNEAEIKAMFGPSEVGILEANIRAKEQVPAAIEAYYSYYDEGHCQYVQPRDEIVAMLDALKAKGLKLGVYTGKARRSYDLSCGHLQLGSWFDAAITGDDVEQPKPHPEGIFKALASMGLAPDEALYVGDSDADVEAGARAGVRTVGVTWFTGGEGTFRTAPDFTADSFNEWMKHAL